MHNSTSEKELSHNDSLQLIQQMIGAAKDQHNERGEGWIIWGWVLFIASAGSALLSYIDQGMFVRWIWMAVLPVGFVIYFLTHGRNRKQTKVKTYISGLLDKIEGGFFISLIIMIIGSNIIGNYLHQYGHYLFGYYFVLYAFWMYIHGSATQFKPLIVGAFFNWAAAVAIFCFSDFEIIMMISAVAVLAGYIIPGYIQRRDYKKSIVG